MHATAVVVSARACARAETGWEVTIRESGRPTLRLEIPTHSLLMEVVAALAEEEAPTAVDGLAAVAATGDTSIEYRLPHVAWPDTSGPWGRDERGPIRAWPRRTRGSTDSPRHSGA